VGGAGEEAGQGSLRILAVRQSDFKNGSSVRERSRCASSHVDKVRLRAAKKLGSDSFPELVPTTTRRLKRSRSRPADLRPLV
jgi:hypothetical protein